MTWKIQRSCKQLYVFVFQTPIPCWICCLNLVIKNTVLFFSCRLLSTDFFKYDVSRAIVDNRSSCSVYELSNTIVALWWWIRLCKNVCWKAVCIQHIHTLAAWKFLISVSFFDIFLYHKFDFLIFEKKIGI